MNKLILSALAALTTLAPTAALAEGKLLYQPYPVDVNRYNNALQAKERQGGFDYWNKRTIIKYISDGTKGVYRINNPCKDFIVKAKVEGRVLVTIISPCLVDKITAVDGKDNPDSWYGNAEGFGYELMDLFRKNQNNLEDRYSFETKIRTSAGKLVGECDNHGECYPALYPSQKVHVSKDQFVRVR